MFTAIITRNFRDVNTSSPKVLLLKVQSDSELFRDHCWVTISDALREFVPRKNHIKTKICFDAKVNGNFTLFFHSFHKKPSTFLNLKQAYKIVA